MRRFSQRRPHIAGKPLTDHAAVGNLLKLPDHIFTLRANLTPGVMCVRQLRFIVDGHKQIYGRPDAPSEAWTSVETRFNWHSISPCFSSQQRLSVETSFVVNLLGVQSASVKATESISLPFLGGGHSYPSINYRMTAWQLSRTCANITSNLIRIAENEIINNPKRHPIRSSQHWIPSLCPT